VTTCYHTTSATAAASILTGGFRDNTEDHPLFGEITGVYLGEEPPAGGVGFPVGTPAEKYAQVLQVQFEDDYDLDQFVLDPSPPRIWHLPASEINNHATVKLLSKQSSDEEQT
jgi:hypothetical protein